jgi:hypothetical protein
VVTFVVFFTLGVEKITARYFVFSVPPLTALIIISISVFVWKIPKNPSFDRRSIVLSVSSVALGVALIVPNGYDAAARVKPDIRGNVQRVISVVQSAPDTDFFIVEAEHRRTADYYFERFSDEVKVNAIATRFLELNNTFQSKLDSELPKNGSGTKIIVLFNHSRLKHFPNLLEYLGDRYTLIHSSVNNLGRGYLVFDTSTK